MKKREKHPKCYNSERVEPIWFMLLGQISRQMALTDDLYEVNKKRSGISSVMNYKRFADSSEWSEHQKQRNAIHFEYKKFNITRALNYFKQTYPYKMMTKQA